jgi:phosphomannomutase
VITIDGLRAEYADGFGLVRASNTTPVLVLRFEGQTPGGAGTDPGAVHGAVLAVKPDAHLGASAH